MVCLSILLGLQVLPWPTAAVILPASSPLVAMGSALAARQIGWITWLALPLLLLALVKGRWFCRHLCPVGFILDMLGYFNRRYPRSYKRVPPIGRWLVMLAAGTAAAGYAWFLWMDPLVLFNGFVGVWRHIPVEWKDLLPASGFSLVILFTLWRPHAWCERCCPLGALQELCGRAGDGVRCFLCKPSKIAEGGADGNGCSVPAERWPGPISKRREVLMILAGGMAIWVIRYLRGGDSVLPLRPPGAVDEKYFSGLCVRCGSCMQACPQRILIPDLGQSGVGGFLTPVVDYDRNYCDEWCYQCTQVCPTGAIRRMTLEEKRDVVMGVARIDRSRCIAWSQQQYCMVCNEFCPYQAIRTRENLGVPCPEVNATLCRGCGACQSNCPAIPHKAIVVYGRR